MDKETIIQARETDLARYLIGRGEELEKNGKRHKHKIHDSLVFTKNLFYWNSRSLKGNAIDFLMLYYDMDFKTAVFELTGKKLNDYANINNINKASQSDFDFNNVKTMSNFKRTIAYLCNPRCINYDIVIDLIKKKLIYQEESTNNVIFPIRDETTNIVGIEYHGTLTQKSYKGIAKNSKYGYGYSIFYGTPKNAIFFESAIDLISFINVKMLEHKELKNIVLISMAGLKLNIINNLLSVHCITSKPILCVDNDNAGLTFVESVKSTYGDIKVYFPAHGKDWNEYLQFLHKPNQA